MPDVNMPKLSDTMEEGTIVEWKKKSGDTVKRGEVLAEVESDKATFDLESEADGVLDIIVEQGVPAKIGAPIARIGAAGEAAKPREAKPENPKAEPAKAAPPRAEVAEESSPPPKSEPEGAPARRDSDGAATVDVKASPLARRLAAEMGVDIATLKGSGPEGRIVKEDVMAAAGSKAAVSRPAAAAAPSRPAGPDVELVEPNRMQATIARRMVEAKTTVPNFNVTVEARVDLAV